MKRNKRPSVDYHERACVSFFQTSIYLVYLNSWYILLI